MYIRDLRTKLGDTQSEFAARYHIPFRTVQNWEAGVRTPPEYVMRLLERRIREDLVNRKTAALPKYCPSRRLCAKRPLRLPDPRASNTSISTAPDASSASPSVPTMSFARPAAWSA